MNSFLPARCLAKAIVVLAVFGSLQQSAPFSTVASAQSTAKQPLMSTDDIRKLVVDLKDDARGPFQIVKWFCPDGTTIPARERCAEPGGQQRAVPKDIVLKLQQRNRIYFGQILAGTPTDDFLDRANAFSRLKQYQLERYLARVDDGWIFRQARFYRGAFQVEDEEAWGEAFLRDVLMRDALIRSSFYVLRESARDLPHARPANYIQLSRSLSQEISDAFPGFLALRVKIHGQPDRGDLALVETFRSEQTDDAPPAVKQKLDALVENLKLQYDPDYSRLLAGPLSRIRRATPIAADIRAFEIESATPQARASFFADVMMRVRSDLGSYSRPSERLALIDLSLLAESVVFESVAEWTPTTIGGLIEKASVLRDAAYGAGFLEAWEYQQLLDEERDLDATVISTSELKAIVSGFQRAVEWSASLVNATYAEPVATFAAFEPLATGFVDDRIRSTVLLPFGDVTSQLSARHAQHVGLVNETMGLGASAARGLNPGVALGTLEVITGEVEHIDFRTDRIYVMERTPAELKPVGGIATVTEGNLVSHVQLLARNLGIPNAVFPQDLVTNLTRFSGQRVFFAVSPGGRVRLKPADQMTAEERLLVEQRKREETLVRVPTDRLDLEEKRLLSLFDLRATDSGRVCGPKAANLGQLSALFPGRVAPGFIVPFGMFREHMDQTMPNSDRSYWQELRLIFARAAEKKNAGAKPDDIDTSVLAELAELRAAIETMPLKPDFVSMLNQRFTEEFGLGIGKVPIFVRSDTNMEDLKDFTGAGLNLTVPNVVTVSDIHDGIRRVWASPFRERGYRWRQKYLLNPEDVYPSLLILKSVNVDKSGVLISSGITSGDPDDYTIAFNRGVGGAVDGQAAESYLLDSAGRVMLIAPARETTYSALPRTGGIERRSASFEERILSVDDLGKLRSIGSEIREVLPNQPGIETAGPFDVELGFAGNKLILFQARPFVQNRNAGSINYLMQMDIATGSSQRVDLGAPILTN